MNTITVDPAHPTMQGADMPTVSEYLSRAVELATKNVDGGGGPFGAIVVTGDGQVFEGSNRVTANNDPTAHAEVSAIRNACSELETFDLSGATLYTSCEPCPMCLASSLWARIGRVYFAADRRDAADAGFDDALFYDYFDGESEAVGVMPVSQAELPPVQRVSPFTAWSENEARIDY